MKRKKKNKEKIGINKGAITGKYNIIVVALLLLGGAIFIFASLVALPSDSRNIRREEGRKEIQRGNHIILPKRGNIYTYDGRLLAASEPSYIITMDFWAPAIRKDSLERHIDALAASLARRFPDRSAAQYRNIIMSGWETREREERRIAAGDSTVRRSHGSARIISRPINYAELKELRACPYLRQTTLRRAMVEEHRNARVMPFENLAARTVGNVFPDMAKGGSSGLEQRFNEYLSGREGRRVRQRIPGGWVNVVVTPPIDGNDIVTTLDANYQDIAERALRNMLIDANAEAGTAIVMEVKTGAIRAISNLERRRGVIQEGSPNAFSWMHEPGSTFKTVAAMIALEDGVVQPTDSFLVGRGVWRPNNRLTVTDWDADRVDRGHYTLQRGMEMSSNVVMARMLMGAYGDNPAKFIAGIDRIGLTDTTLVWDVPISGREGTSWVRRTDNPHWSNATSLGVMSYGYEMQIPPIRMLMFYNAIANGGKMVQPFIAQRIVRDGRTIQEFSGRVVNPNIFQKRTTRNLLHEMLLGVVDSGTATSIRSPYFDIAGKTGTAVLANRAGYGAGHFVSFAGYFPADNPEYTIFVGIRNPSGIPSGARHAGMVFKNIAEEIFVRNERLAVNQMRIDTTLAVEPRIKNGKWAHNRQLLSSLRLPVTNTSEATDWVRMQRDSMGNFEPRPLTVEPGVVPDVRGMGARDALFLLEKTGLRVTLNGSGRVVRQSINPGTRSLRGGSIEITLSAP